MISYPPFKAIWSVFLLVCFSPLLTLAQNTILLDDFIRADDDIVGNSWIEVESTTPTSIGISGNQLRMEPSTGGRDWAYRDIDNFFRTAGISGSTDTLRWAINMATNDPNIDGFDTGQAGIAFILGKTTTGITDGEGYAVIYGPLAGVDSIQFVRFSGGLDANADFTTLAKGFLANSNNTAGAFSIRVDYDPANDQWDFYMENATGTVPPQTDPRNTATLIASVVDTTYTGNAFDLRYTGVFYNHNQNKRASFDDIYVPDYPPATVSFLDNDSTVIEENFYLSLPVNLSSYGGAPVLVTVTASPLTAEPGEDYVFDTDTLTFSADGSLDISILIKNDQDEEDESFLLTLSILAGHADIGIDTTLQINITDDGIKLPVEFTYFTATAQGSEVVLQWGTARESNNSHFVVEHGVDGADFRAVGQVAGAGDSDSPLDYSFTDNRPASGANYYRLRQVDFDGTEDFSVVRVVILNANPGEPLLAPNPATDLVYLQFPEESSLPERIRIFTADGRLVKDLPFQGESISVEELVPGVYWIQAGQTSLRLLKK